MYAFIKENPPIISASLGSYNRYICSVGIMFFYFVIQFFSSISGLLLFYVGDIPDLAVNITMAGVSNPSKLGKWLADFKAYHSKHPLIVGYSILCGVSFIWLIQFELKADRKMECVSKYKPFYIVLRPDDPKVSMIKKGRVGLDY